MVESFLDIKNYGKLRFVNQAITTAPTWDERSGAYSGAVYDHLNVLCLTSLRPSHVTPNHPTDPLTINRATLPTTKSWSEAIYGGHFCSAWGHFLIETLSTALLSTSLPRDVPVLFMPFQLVENSPWREQYFRHVEPLLKVAWHDREIVILSGVTVTERLWVPPRLAAFGFQENGVAPEMRQVYDRIVQAFGQPRSATGKTLLLRRALDHRHVHPREAAIYRCIERELSAETFEPWKHSAQEQVRVISGASRIIGFSGSHLHNSVFMHRGGAVVEMNSPSYGNFSPAQADLDAACGHATLRIPTFDDGSTRILDEDAVIASIQEALRG
jgi:capsular polysaccharide biosynthesis protein